MKPYEVLPLIGSLLQFRLRYNPFGVLSLSFGAAYVYYIINGIGICLLTYFIIRGATDRFDRWALSAVLGGALGNTLDRIRLGKVVDFIDMGIRDTRWPTYNLADAALTIGIIVVLAHEFFGRKPTATTGAKHD